MSRCLRLVLLVLSVLLGATVASSQASTATSQPTKAGSTQKHVPVSTQPQPPATSGTTEQHAFDIAIWEESLKVLWTLSALIVVWYIGHIVTALLAQPAHEHLDNRKSGYLASVSVSVEEMEESARHANAIVALFKRYGFPASAKRMMSSSGPSHSKTADREVLDASRTSLEPLYRKAFESISYTQMCALELVVVRPRSYAEIRTLLIGVDVEFIEWLRLITVFGLIEQCIGRDEAHTIVSITHVGALFLGWCDVLGLSSNSVRDAGRLW